MRDEEDENSSFIIIIRDKNNSLSQGAQPKIMHYALRIMHYPAPHSR